MYHHVKYTIYTNIPVIMIPIIIRVDETTDDLTYPQTGTLVRYSRAVYYSQSTVYEKIGLFRPSDRIICACVPWPFQQGQASLGVGSHFFL